MSPPTKKGAMDIDPFYKKAWEEEKRKFEDLKSADRLLFNVARDAGSYEEILMLLQKNNGQYEALKLSPTLLRLRTFLSTVTVLLVDGISYSQVWSLSYLVAEFSQRISGAYGFVTDRLSTISSVLGSFNDLLGIHLETARKSDSARYILFSMQVGISKLLRALYGYLRWGVKNPTLSREEFRHHEAGKIWDDGMQEMKSQLKDLEDVLKAQP